jgi:hypothetical protein
MSCSDKIPYICAKIQLEFNIKEMFLKTTVILKQIFERYIHKTSGFKTSGFKTSETSGLQNVRFTKRQVYQTSGSQNVRFTNRQVFKTSGCKKTSIYGILYLWLVEIRRFFCSPVCGQSDGCVLFSILEGFFAIYHHNR